LEKDPKECACVVEYLKEIDLMVRIRYPVRNLKTSFSDKIPENG